MKQVKKAAYKRATAKEIAAEIDKSLKDGSLKKVVGSGIYSKQKGKWVKLKTETIPLKIPIEYVKYAKQIAALTGEKYTEFLEFNLAMAIEDDIAFDKEEAEQERKAKARARKRKKARGEL